MTLFGILDTGNSYFFQAWFKVDTLGTVKICAIKPLLNFAICKTATLGSQQHLPNVKNRREVEYDKKCLFSMSHPRSIRFSSEN